jgi:hypothetical protein
MEKPEPRPDASAPKPAPSASASHAPPTEPPYVPPKFPTRPAHYDAGVHPSTTVDHDVAQADAGHGCKVPSDCGANAPYCDPLTGRCVNCLGDFHCGLGTHCDMATQECVCSSDSECRYTGRCDTLTRQCLWPCTSKDQCSLISPICDMSRTVCVQCLTNTECVGKTIGNIPTTLCHRGLCVQCADDTECSGTKPFCQLRGAICVECLRSADCHDKAQCFDGICLVPPPGPTTSPSSMPSGSPNPSPSGSAP